MMAKKTTSAKNNEPGTSNDLCCSIGELMSRTIDKGDDDAGTGRYIVTFKEGVREEGSSGLEAMGLRIADARDFESQAVDFSALGDAGALVMPEIGVAVMASDAMKASAMSAMQDLPSDSPIASIEPEGFVFTMQQSADYIRGFMQATDAIASGLGLDTLRREDELDAEVLGVTWGLQACNVPMSTRSGAGIRVAVLDTGMDEGHPDFVGRRFTSNSFVGEPVHDLNSHGTHCIGTACGPKAPNGAIPRYGIANGSSIFVGKVLSNAGSGSDSSVLAGMNWAIANRCEVISMSLGSARPPQTAYTAAGQAALSHGLLIIAAAGNGSGKPTGAPANSPTIMAVASLDRDLSPSSFSNMGKIEIAAPGRDVFSSEPRPKRHGTKSGTSMATPHVAGCAALWAQTSPGLRGQALWNRLVQSAKPLPHDKAKVGSGLVQAPS